MKKILFLLFLSIATYTSTFAQTPVVIKQDSTVRDLDDEEEYDVRDLSFRERLRFGGGITGLQFWGNQTLIGVAPMAGYQATNDITVGVGLSYQYYNSPIYGAFKENQFGPRVFGQYRLHFLDSILSNMFAQAELQKYYVSNAFSSREYSLQTLAGLGMGYGGFQITVLRDLTYKDYYSSPTGSPWVIRIGGFFF